MNEHIALRADTFSAADSALSLNPSLLKSVDDISYEQANTWINTELSNINTECQDELQQKIKHSFELVNNVHMSSYWPIATTAHMHLICILSELIDAPIASGCDEEVMTLETANYWADGEVDKYRDRDASAIAERIAKSAEKLKQKNLCERFPFSAFAYRKLIVDLSIILHDKRGQLH